MPDWKDKVDMARLPKHIAVIMDGNGRWAKQHKKPRVFGHKNGVKAVREITEGAAELGIRYLTLYAFSTENWHRPALEVNALMMLLVETLNKEVQTLNKNKIKLQAIGDINGLPEKTKKVLKKAIHDTKDNDRMTLILALNYSSRWEIKNTVQKIARKVQNGELLPEQIDHHTIKQQLETSPYPDPELLIRTSGELRISNFLLYQIAYTELYFTQKFWPDFDKNDLYKALIDYQGRERRFGKISEQHTS